MEVRGNGTIAFVCRCSTHIFMHYDYTEAEALAAWNSMNTRTCHIVTDGHGWWECDDCGSSIYWDSVDEPPNCDYCPSCGARVVEE